MITKEIIEELKESNIKMRNLLEDLNMDSHEAVQKLRCELLKTLELLPSESHDDRNNRPC
jgi:hypothetical protein